MFFISGFSLIYIDVKIIVVCTPSLSAEEIKPPTKFSKKKGMGSGLDKTSTLRGGLLEKRRVTLQGGLQFYKKNKLKSEIFNDKKSL